MKYKGIATPSPSLGIDFSKIKDECVPNQSMSLAEILKRFVRGEALPVGFESQEGEAFHTDEDLEKMKYADLTDKAEYSAKLNKIQVAHRRQEEQKAAKAKANADKKAKIAQQKKIEEAARKLAKESSKS